MFENWATRHVSAYTGSWSGRVMKACRLANCRSTLRFLPPRSAIIFQR